MYIIVAACILFGALLAKSFKCFILIPACALIVGFDLFIDHGVARGVRGAALEIVTLVTSLQIGYVAGALSPLLLAALARQKTPAIFANAPFARALSRDGRMLGSTRNGVASEASGAQRKDTIKPAA
jgi:hypothetical protein